jgi:hypothetical protein
MTTSLSPTTRQPRRSSPAVAVAGAAGAVALLVTLGTGTSVWTDVFGGNNPAPSHQAPAVTVPAGGGTVIESPCFRAPLGGMPDEGGVPMCTTTIAP